MPNKTLYFSVAACIQKKSWASLETDDSIVLTAVQLCDYFGMVLQDWPCSNCDFTVSILPVGYINIHTYRIYVFMA